MAVYRIFPDKDTFIKTDTLTANAGRDEILEVGGYSIPTSDNGQTRRSLIRFANADINDVVDNQIGSTNFSASLGMYYAEGTDIPIEYTVEAFPVAQDWDEGLGKDGDTPTNETGCSWQYTQASKSILWTTASFGGNITGSFSSTYPGGGSWFYEVNGNTVNNQQIFLRTAFQDLDLDVSQTIKDYYNGIIPNNGFILKLTDDLEFNTSSSVRLKYFSTDTNTIYPPYLEFKWEDFSYNTGSFSTVTSSEIKVGVRNRKDKYVNEGKNRFRLFVRDLYPTRTFTTSSIYTTGKLLPTASYWGLRDENTEEMVIDFDTRYTKISADSTSNYFDIYMDGLQPERYYRLLVKSIIDGTTNVIDDNMVFKVVRNG
jgi:hypothetical protein